jgi:hypothetical protein
MSLPLQKEYSMLKWLLLAGILYFVYRFYKKPAAVEPPRKTEEVPSRGSASRDDDGEFIDYEEVD